VLAGGSALLGWVIDAAALKTLAPGGAAMNPATAVALCLAGASLFLTRRGAGRQARRLGLGLGFLAAAAGGSVLVAYALGSGPGIDSLLFAAKLGGNRMAVNTAVLFVLIGGALLAQDVAARPARSAAQGLAVAALALCLTALVGYSFGVPVLYGVVGHTPMAFNTAVAMTALAIGTLCARPGRGPLAVLAGRGAGGILTRRLTPAAVAVPWTLGWLRLAGERAGLYESQFGVALLVVSTIALFLLFVWVGGARLDRIDAKRRRAEAALRRSSDEIRDLYDNAPCGYHSVGPDGVVLAMNRTELRWLGYAAEEVVGRLRFADVVAAPSREAYQAAFARVREQGSAGDVEIDLVRRDGTTFPVLLNSSAVRGPDGGYRRSRTTLTDMTERKRAVETLRQGEERFRRLVEGVKDYAILMLAPDGTVASWNPGAERIKGYTAGEIVGRHFSDFYPPEDVAAGKTETALRAAADDGRFEEEGWRVRKGGSRFWASVVITPLWHPDGRLAGFVKVTRDLTERKRSEDAIRRLNDELEERVRNRTAELAEANRDLAQKNAENEMFVYSVSHDLRSPLVNLQGFSGELEKGCGALAALLGDGSVKAPVRDPALALLGGRMAKALGFIRAAVLRLSGIIDALLRLSRAGRVEYRKEHVEISRAVRRVVESLNGTIEERRARVVVAGDLPPAWGDATALEQVFANLVGNALTYLDPGRAGVVEVGCLPPAAADAPTYYVRDNGLGIPEGHRAKIFQAFQRAHPHVGTGEGLGLAIVARVVERHRGKVWVESRAGEGSTFFVTLPAAPKTMR
jgi:PAS domain S-box-containing protein